LLDSAYLTTMRTAAMTIVALRALARPSAERALIVGAGRQGSAQAEALRAALPGLRRLEIHDVRSHAAAALASDVGGAVSGDLRAAAAEADVLVTTTPSREAFLDDDMVAPGATVLAYGADGPGKRELSLDLLVRARVVTDLRRQALESGELQHVAAAGREDVFAEAAEIGAVLAGLAVGRPADEAVVVYDATGTALQDAVAAGLLIAAAESAGRGARIDLAA
jgi:ornithine cyclodeaminase